jgi:hypothetical protein
MTQPVSSWSGLVCLDGSNEDLPAPAATPAAPPPPPPPPTAASIAAARAAALAVGRDRQVQQALDGFFRQWSALTVTVQGQALTTSVPFHMAHRGEGAGLVAAGRGTLVDIRHATNALIDNIQSRDSSQIPHDSVSLRQLMFSNRIGIDCAGYVRQAAIAARLFGDDGQIADDDLSPTKLAAHGFALVPDHRTARPGDIFVLGPTIGQLEAVGHRAIVYSHEVSPRDQVPSDVATQLGYPAGAVHVFQVDSSWGASKSAQNGGVRRETWWYGEATGLWAWQRPAPSPQPYVVTSTPYGHAFGTGGFGLYRAGTRK